MAMNRNTLVGIAIVAIVAIVAVVLIADRPDDTRSAAGGSGGNGELSGETFDGATVNVADYRGKPVVINFFASWCGPCNEEADELAAFSRDNPDVAFVGVDTGDKLEDGKAFVDKYGLDYPIVFDPDGAIAGAWGVDGIPTTVFLDADGVEQDRIVGAAGTSDFEAALRSVQ